MPRKSRKPGKSFAERSIRHYRPICIRLLQMRAEGCTQAEMCEVLTQEGYSPYKSALPWYQVLISRLLALADQLQAQGRLVPTTVGATLAKHAADSLKVSAPVTAPVSAPPATSAPASPALPKKPWVEDAKPAPQPKRLTLLQIEELERQQEIKNALADEQERERGYREIARQVNNERR